MVRSVGIAHHLYHLAVPTHAVVRTGTDRLPSTLVATMRQLEPANCAVDVRAARGDVDHDPIDRNVLPATRGVIIPMRGHEAAGCWIVRRRCVEGARLSGRLLDGNGAVV